MSSFKKVISILNIAFRAKLHEISIPVFIEFVFANIGDFLEPKYNIIKVLFFVFLIITVYCIYKIASWARKNEIAIPVSKDQVLAKPNGLSDSLVKGIPLATIGLAISAIFLLLQLSIGKNDKGALASLLPQLQPIQQSLLGIDSKLNEIDKKLDNVKKETSDDARKELQNIGVAWSGKNFLDAIKTGDERVVKLFLQAGMHAETAESDGRSLAVMLSLNDFNPEKMLALLLANGLDINQQYGQYSASGQMKTTLLGRAIEKGNTKLVAALLSNNTDTNKPLQTYGTMGIATEKYPLQSAIYWKHTEIALLIINAKTDIAVGDYAAYRQAYSMKNDYYWKEHQSELNQIIEQTAPPAGKSKRINTELRIQEIDNELNDVAKKSLLSYSNPYQKKQYDQRYDELQEEKKKLLATLKADN